MKNILKILSGLALLTIAYGARQFYLLYNAKFNISKTQINKITSNEIDMIIFGLIESKSDISAIVTGQHYEVFLNGKLVSTINAKQIIHINSNGKTILPIAVKFSPKAILQNGLNNLVNLLLDRTQIGIEIKGYLTIEVGVVKLKNYIINIKYTLQELIDSSKAPAPPIV